MNNREVKASGYRFKLIVFNLVKSVNVGTLMRTAYAFGCDELVTVGRKKFKFTGSSGSWRALKQRHFFNLPEAVAYCRNEGFRIYGVEIGGKLINQTRFDHHAAFILGNEGRGLSDAEPHVDTIVSIPQWGGIPSLNVAVAGGIVLYEFQRQQHHPPAAVEGERYYDDFFSL